VYKPICYNTISYCLHLNSFHVLKLSIYVIEWDKMSSQKAYSAGLISSVYDARCRFGYEKKKMNRSKVSTAFNTKDISLKYG
jgi:hypothetical protein